MNMALLVGILNQQHVSVMIRIFIVFHIVGMSLEAASPATPLISQNFIKTKDSGSPVF